MRVRCVELKGFRNYASAAFEPDAGVTVLCGRNAQGKTNLLEAVVLCSVGRSHRTNHDREMVQWDTQRARVSLEAEHSDGTHDVKIILSRGGDARTKQILIGSSPVARIGELMGHVPSVLFSPEDLRLVKEGPGERRRFLDITLSQLRPEYFYALQQYQRSLKQRNELLRKLSLSCITGSAAEAQLEPWDELLSETGARIVKHRAWFIERLARKADESHAYLSGSREALSARFVCSFEDKDEPARNMLDALKRERARDLASHGTSVGPHRDDFELMIDRKPVRVYGSQGQQRTAALALKLSALSILRDELSETPILLLDDVMSELDASRRRQLLTWMPDVQTIITCTDESDLVGAEAGIVYQVEQGGIRRD